MKQIAIIICVPITLLISLSISLTYLDSASPVMRWLITVIIASSIGISSYSLLVHIMKAISFPYWERLAQNVDQSVEFRLSYIGHLLYIGRIGAIGFLIYLDAVYIAPKQHLAYALLVMLLILISLYLRSFLYRSWRSPLYEGPFLEATPSGIRDSSCFIPWGDVESVTVGGDRYSIDILVNTKKGCSEYDHAAKKSASEPHQIIFKSVRGALPESIAHYLNVRTKIQNMAR